MKKKKVGTGTVAIFTAAPACKPLPPPMDLGDFETTVKVIVVGNGGVGKSSMTARYCKGVFTSTYKKTIGECWGDLWLPDDNGCGSCSSHCSPTLSLSPLTHPPPPLQAWTS